MKTVKLEQWCCIPDPRPDGFVAPERRSPVLVGNCTGHPRKPDGDRIATSAIVDAKGRLVETASGTLYELGEPEPKYLEWLKENRPDWDPENPIKLLWKN